MGNMQERIIQYKFYSVVFGIIWFIAAVTLVKWFSGTFVQGMLVGFAMIFIFVGSQLYLSHKASTMKCPTCGKVVFTRTSGISDSGFPDETYAQCYFCKTKLK